MTLIRATYLNKTLLGACAGFVFSASAGGVSIALAETAKPAPTAVVSTIPDVPGDDIFGFTTPTNLGNPGDRSFINENDGRLGKRDGRYGGLNAKYEFGYTITEDWWVAASPFLSIYHLKDVTGFADNRTFAFDGISFEVAHRLIARSERNPFAVTATVEPRWGRIDGEGGLRSESVGFTAKLFVDSVIVPDTLYWAGNLNWSPVWAKDPIIPDNNLLGSVALASTALSWRFAPGLFLAAEVRYFAAYARIAPDHLTGQAVFAGPALLWKINDNVAVNVTWQPQIWGRSQANPDMRLDLDNFERSTFRAKHAVVF